MQDELISKKDLLNEMSISYGQLYRWKRKKLIPEEWFIKKSVSTGQETFFPRKKIIERVQTILECKDGISLDELAYKFSKNIKDILINKTYIIDKNIVSSSKPFSTFTLLFTKNCIKKSSKGGVDTSTFLERNHSDILDWA